MRKVDSLLGRIQFIDLSIAMAKPAIQRKDHLRAYLGSALLNRPLKSYEQFRRAIPSIYGVSRGLDLSPPPTLAQLKSDVTRACKGKDTDMNVDAVEDLFNFVRPLGHAAYDHPAQSLQLGPKRTAAIRINHYVVDSDELMFQFVSPRRKPVDGDVLDLMLSMIKHSYAVDDYETDRIEIVDMSCDTEFGPRGGIRYSDDRNIKIQTLKEGSLIPMADMAPLIQSVHDLLLEIGKEPD